MDDETPTLTFVFDFAGQHPEPAGFCHLEGSSCLCRPTIVAVDVGGDDLQLVRIHGMPEELGAFSTEVL